MSREQEESEQTPIAALRTTTNLDTELGLFYVAGNEQLYRQVLGSLIKDYGDAGARIREMISREDLSPAQAIVHTIKGLAGTVGAGELRATADSLDTLLKDARGQPGAGKHLQPACEQFAKALDDLVSELRAAGIEEPASPGSHEDVRPASSSRIFPEFTVLLVDDDERLVRSLATALAAQGVTNVAGARDGATAIARLEREDVGLVLLDLSLPGESGLDLLPRIRSSFPSIPVVVVTADDDVATAVECMRLGAMDYLVKGGDPNRFIATTRLGIEIQQLRRENRTLSSGFLAGTLDSPEAFEQIITADDRMIAAFHYVEAIAKSSSTVLICGESGTGKDLFAEAIHRASGRSGDFVTANVAGFDDALFADALFGHVKGAFTGAERSRAGLIDRASSGTLFLDEIGELSVPSQVKLLRLLEAREYYPVGSDIPKTSDARTVVATNRDLEASVADGSFRFDLYYRLATHQLELPPLRERRDDIRLLFDHFARLAARELESAVPACPPEVISSLLAYDYPGNVRELRSMAFDAVSRSGGGQLEINSFPVLANRTSRTTHVAEGIRFPDPLPTIRETTEQLIREAMRRSGSNQTAAAAMLGISQSALSQRLKRHTLSD